VRAPVSAPRAPHNPGSRTGNLKYTTTKEEIAKHFAACGPSRPCSLTPCSRPYADPPPTIRLLTPKPKPGAPPPARIIKSKGCAFLEFASGPALQAGLRLHHSVLDGRQVNVELTAGGGGNSESRLTKLKTRNKELATRRVRPPPAPGPPALT
jgi:nucleolar protein 6